MRCRGLVFAVLLCLPLGAGRVSAQDSAARDPVRRARLEQQFRRRLWRVAQMRLGLTEEQMGRLEPTVRRFDARRHALATEERQQRVILRTEILADERADQRRIGGALDKLYELQRARLELHGEEQRELAAFLSPLQRAKYAALQEQLRRRADAMRRQRPDRDTEFPPR